MHMDIPPIIYGTAWKKERTKELVIQAVNAGFRGIDTACQPKHYHEAGVGDALAALREQGIQREELYVQTKFTPVAGQDPDTIPYDKEAPPAEQVEQSFAASQKNLRSDYVDALVLHTPLFPFSHLLSVWRAMEKIQKSGGARQLGISNCYDLAVLKRLYSEAGVKPFGQFRGGGAGRKGQQDQRGPDHRDSTSRSPAISIRAKRPR